MITAYPKIFAIGTDYIRDLFLDDVEVTEKIDGSQFAFGIINGQLEMRSKGARLYPESHDKMFAQAVDYVQQIQHRLPPNMAFYAEYLKSPKHNTLKYGRIPKNHLMLFGAIHVNTQVCIKDTAGWAIELDIENVPVFHVGKINSLVDLVGFMDRTSVLGDAKIEGIVIKNYFRPFLLGGQPIPVMAGKFVSEHFKEVHRDRWGTEEKGKSRMEVFFESFRTPARWEKTVQRLTEDGQLERDPRDIGKLIKAVHLDIQAEEMDNVKNFLWNEFHGELKRRSTFGLPEWYKERLLNKVFE